MNRGNKPAFNSLLTKRDKILGFIYIFVHAVGLSYIMQGVVTFIFPIFGITANGAWITFGGYLFSFFMVLALLSGFMKRSFNVLMDNKLRSLLSIFLGYAMSVILSAAAAYIMVALGEAAGLGSIMTNPNQDAINAMAKANPAPLKAAAIILGPIVEEVLFRGVLFGTVREKSRILAYVVSAIAFAFYHLWSSFIFDYNPYLFIQLIAYIPYSISLAYTYERSGNIWSSIGLHMIINAIGLAVA